MTDRRNIDPQEWALRCDLAAAYRLFARFDMDDLIFTHLSVRLPGKDHRFLLNPFGDPRGRHPAYRPGICASNRRRSPRFPQAA